MVRAALFAKRQHGNPVVLLLESVAEQMRALSDS
jgi:hypothetical protein